MAQIRSIVFQNATILVPRGPGDDHVVALKNHSILIEGNKISQIAPQIDAPSASTEMVDCTAKIICPGFVDTHHHVWQTQLKGRHADHTLIEYMAPGNMASYSYTPEDMFWGELGGCLEAMEAGTTTLVDHAHLTYSPKHSEAAISATVSSGIRSVYCYTPITMVKAWKPKLELEEDQFPGWLFEKLAELCKASPFGNGRVSMGFGFDSLFLPKPMVIDIFNNVRAMGVKTITTHSVATLAGSTSVDLLEDYGLLDKDILFSHATPLSDSDARKISKAQAFISSTPDTELQMGHGWPVCFQENGRLISSLGVDCHSNNTGSIVAQMRVGLQAERARRNDKILQAGEIPARINVHAQDAFQLGTIRGARAIHMEDKIGSLEVGKIADLVIFDTLSPGMICAAEEDPIGAIILHSSVSDIDSVMVDGEFRKRGGRLATTKLDVSLAPWFKPSKMELEWRDVALELLAGRERIIAAEKKSGADDFEAATESAINLFQLSGKLHR